MKKKINIKNNIALRSILFVAISVLVLFFIYTNFYSPSSPMSNNTQQTKQFESKDLKFSISLPTFFIIEEKLNSIFLKANNGDITISRIATNFGGIEDYLIDFDSKRKIRVSNQEAMSISDYPTIKRTEIFLAGPIEKQKVYFIYVNGWVYSLSTSSEALFSDLDQIAQSFRYNP